MITIWSALTYYNQKTVDSYNNILQRYLKLNTITAASSTLVTTLNTFVIDPSMQNEFNLRKSIELLQEKRANLAIIYTSDNAFTVTNFGNLIDSLIETTKRTLTFKNMGDSELATNSFEEATRISTYISETSLTLVNLDLITYEQQYREIIEQSEQLRKFGIWLLLLITFVLLFITYWFSLSITRPIMLLTEAAKQFSRGQFDHQIEIYTNDEISFLARMFNRMRVNINNLIKEIQAKAQLETELQQNKLLLQESQLLILQSQINPHFLFNTLDTLSKKAYIEGAETTSDLLVSVANMLRYNLKRLDKAVTLFEEVNVLRQYIDIQTARFADRLTYVPEIDDSYLHIQIPGLTLQPIVENAVIHAVEPREEGGIIWFRVFSMNSDANGGPDSQVIIEIEDDGPGMSEEQMNNIVAGKQSSVRGHSTGIGLSNVIRRLQIFYGSEHSFSIARGIQGGTKITLRLPLHPSPRKESDSV